MTEEIQSLEGESREVEVVEISLNDSEIDEFVNVLNELKENKGEVSFDISDDTELLIHYEEESEEEEESGEGIKEDGE